MPTKSGNCKKGQLKYKLTTGKWSKCKSSAVAAKNAKEIDAKKTAKSGTGSAKGKAKTVKGLGKIADAKTIPGINTATKNVKKSAKKNVSNPKQVANKADELKKKSKQSLKKKRVSTSQLKAGKAKLSCASGRRYKSGKKKGNCIPRRKCSAKRGRYRKGKSKGKCRPKLRSKSKKSAYNKKLRARRASCKKSNQVYAGMKNGKPYCRAKSKRKSKKRASTSTKKRKSKKKRKRTV
jgi:hypothetical protein